MKTLIIASALCLTSLSAPALADISVTDVKGRTVTVEKLPQRVVLSFYFEDYLAVGGPGAIDKVVALSLTPWKEWRPNQFALYEKTLPSIASIPDIGYADDGSFSAEKVIAAKPELVIMAAFAFDSLGEAVKQIEAAGIPILVLDYNSQTVEKHVTSTLALGKLLGTEERAAKLAQNYQEAMADIDARIAKAGASGKKVYVELAQKGPSEVGNSYGNTMWGALIERLGGKNIAKDQVGNWGPLSPEYVIAQQPDLIFLAGSEWLNRPASVPVGFGADAKLTHERMSAYTARPGWSELPAVKTEAVHAIYHGGARTLSDYVYAQYIAKQLYPDAFADVHPARNLKAYYDTWMPVKAEGTFVLPLKARVQ